MFNIIGLAFMSESIFGVNILALITFVHILGFTIGAGAAFFTDIFFMRTIRNFRFTVEQTHVLKLAGKVVWFGLLILLLSGLILFFNESERLLENSKFQAKLTILSVLVLNGLTFHLIHLPHLKSRAGKDLRLGKNLSKTRSTLLFTSGGISLVSWVTILFLASIPFIDLTYRQIMTTYVILAAFGIISALFVKKHIIRQND